MHALQETFLTAWQRLKPILDADPHELAARLARRSQATLTRPFREWCITLRANDTRLTPYKTIITPGHATAHLLPHEITITRKDLQRLCRPVMTDFPGTELVEFAQRLGHKPHTVRRAIGRNQLRVNKKPRWQAREGAGRCYRKYPDLYADQHFHPGAGWRLQPPDPVWGDFWTHFPDNLPKDFEQTLQRIPLWLAGGNHRTGRWRTRDSSPIGNPQSAIGNSPLTMDNGPLTPDSGLSTHDSALERFWGWQWLCPACQNTCRLIFLPIPFPLPRIFRDYLKPHLKRRHECDPADAHSSFACARCHKLTGAISWRRHAWNDVVTRISGGLLFGHEVEIPPFLNRAPKLPAAAGKRITRNRPAPRRNEVEHLLAQGLSYSEIARELGLSDQAVAWHAGASKKAHNAPTHHELRKILAAKESAKANANRKSA
jgi:hypothetical protein